MNDQNQAGKAPSVAQGGRRDLIIDSVNAIAIDVPLLRHYSGSTYHLVNRATVITQIRTKGGLVSEIYSNDNTEDGLKLVKIIMEELAPLVIGEEIFSYERIWQKMFAHTYSHRDRTLIMESISCVDYAVWDLMGKAANVNVSRLLGGYRDKIEIISIAGYYEEGKTLPDLAKEMAWLKEVGMFGCKMKVGGLSPEEDAARVAVAREGGGADFLLAVDANRGWNIEEAIRFARLIEKYDIAWFEEPCHWYDDIQAMARVRQCTTIPINAGQSELSSHAIRRMLAAKAVDIINFDASEAGGITDWRRAAGLCAIDQVKVGHHEEPQVSMQMLSALPYGTYVECFADPNRDPIWDSLIANRPPIASGKISVPQGGGFGLELNWDMVKKYRIN